MSDRVFSGSAGSPSRPPRPRRLRVLKPSHGRPKTQEYRAALDFELVLPPWSRHCPEVLP